MVEVVISMFIVSVTLVASLSLAPAMLRGDQELADRARAQQLGLELLAESEAAPFDDAPAGTGARALGIDELLESIGITLGGSGSGGALESAVATLGGSAGGFRSGSLGGSVESAELNRSLFTSISDYDGWFASPPESRDGTAYDELAGWAREVQVTFIDPATLDESATETGVRRVTVRVYRGEQELASVVSFRTEAGWEAR